VEEPIVRNATMQMDWFGKNGIICAIKNYAIHLSEERQTVLNKKIKINVLTK